jgi:hypothetical protein
MHIKATPRTINIDFNNDFGCGHRAIAHAAIDRRKYMIMAPSIKDFLQGHVDKLERNYYMAERGSIEAYARNPKDPQAFGSTTITSGIRISASAIYNHLISSFDSV